MKNRKELIDKIKSHFNLNIYETKVWLALIAKGIASVGEIAEISGVPRSRVYDVLESLEKQGFAIPKLGKPVKYIAVKPAIILERIKNGLFKEAEDKIKSLSKIKETSEYKELESLYTTGISPVHASDLTSAIKGRSNIYNYLKDMLSSASKEVVLVTSLEALKKKASFLNSIFEKLRENKIKIYVAASNRKEVEDSDTKATILHLSKQLGVPIRRTRVEARFCVVDDENILMIVTPEKEEENDLAICIKSPFFGKTVNSFLNPIWRTK